MSNNSIAAATTLDKVWATKNLSMQCSVEIRVTTILSRTAKWPPHYLVQMNNLLRLFSKFHQIKALVVWTNKQLQSSLLPRIAAIKVTRIRPTLPHHSSTTNHHMWPASIQLSQVRINNQKLIMRNQIVAHRCFSKMTTRSRTPKLLMISAHLHQTHKQCQTLSETTLAWIHNRLRLLLPATSCKLNLLPEQLQICFRATIILQLIWLTLNATILINLNNKF